MHIDSCFCVRGYGPPSIKNLYHYSLLNHKMYRVVQKYPGLLSSAITSLMLKEIATRNGIHIGDIYPIYIRYFHTKIRDIYHQDIFKQDILKNSSSFVNLSDKFQLKDTRNHSCVIPHVNCCQIVAVFLFANWSIFQKK